MQICSQKLKKFESDGFLILPGLVKPLLCDVMSSIARAHLKERVGPFELETAVGYPGAAKREKDKGGMAIRRLLNALDRDPIFFDWAFSSELKKIINSLLRSKSCSLSPVHHNCIMTKLPYFSSRTDWHQDFRYWSYEQPTLISAWLSLGEENVSNGGLNIIPGSHIQDYSKERFDSNGFFRLDLDKNKEDIEKKVQIELSSGDLLIFHCRTLHSAGWNRSQKEKLSLVFTFHETSNQPTPGTRSASKDPIKLT